MAVNAAEYAAPVEAVGNDVVEMPRAGGGGGGDCTEMAKGATADCAGAPESVTFAVNW